MKNLIRQNFRRLSRIHGQARMFAVLAFGVTMLAAVATAVTVSPEIGASCAVLALGIGAFVNPVGSGTLALVSGIATAPRYLNYIDGISGVANSATATMLVPTDRRYHQLVLRTTQAGVLADPVTTISRIVAEVGSTQILDVTPQQLLDYYRLYGYTPGTGELPIFFSRPWMPTNRQREATSWDLFGQRSCTFRITFLNPAGAVGLTALGEFDLSRNVQKDPVTGALVPFLNILQMFPHTIALAVGDNNVTTYPTERPIHALLMEVSANNVTQVLVMADSVKVFEATTAENDDLLGEYGLDASQFEYPLVFDREGKVRTALTARALNVRVTTDGALTLTTLVVRRLSNFLG